MIKVPNLIEAVEAQKSKKIKRSPCPNNRASSIGYAVPMLNGCLRRGVYERTHWQEKKLWEVHTILIFEEGDLQEGKVMADLQQAGYPIIEQQTPYQWEDKETGEVLVTGHVDGKLMCEKEGTEEHVAIPVEIKSMHPNIFAQIHTWEDFKKKPWTRSYMAQITLYMLMNNIDIGLFILKNKSSGKLKQIIVKLDYELGEACVKAAEAINQHVKEKTLPDRIDDRDVCKDCMFNHVCLPDINFGEEIQIGEDPAFESKLKEYLEIKETAKKAEKMWDEVLRPRMKASTDEKGTLNMVLGNYHLKGKTASNGTFRPKIEIIDQEG